MSLKRRAELVFQSLQSEVSGRFQPDSFCFDDVASPTCRPVKRKDDDHDDVDDDDDVVYCGTADRNNDGNELWERSPSRSPLADEVITKSGDDADAPEDSLEGRLAKFMESSPYQRMFNPRLNDERLVPDHDVPAKVGHTGSVVDKDDIVLLIPPLQTLDAFTDPAVKVA